MDAAPSRRSILRTADPDGALLEETPGPGQGDPPAEHVVGLTPDGDVDAVRDRAETVTRALDLAEVGRVVVGRFPEPAREALARRGDVRYVERDARMTAFAQYETWNVGHIGADTTRANGVTGAGVDVAVLDSGIDSDHPDLAGNVGAGYAAIECGTTAGGAACSSIQGACDVAWDDDDGHGTHVAGIIAATDDTAGVVGVAPDATVHAVKVLDCDGSGTASVLADGLQVTADQGWPIANMSLGFGYDSNDEAIYPSVVEDAIQYADARGVLMIAAAGNNGTETVCEDGDCVSYPAAAPQVVAVSALENTDDLAAFSNRGPEIELGAPGGGDADGDGTTECPSEMIYSAVPTETTYNSTTYSYLCYQGTSQASPHVAGVAALAADSATLWNHAGLRDRLGATADDVGLATVKQGQGRVDADGATLTVSPWLTSQDHGLQYGGVAVDADHVYVGGLGTDVRALDRGDGSTVWTHTRDGALADSTPVLAGDALYVGSGGGTVYRLAPGDGSVDWTHTTDSAHVATPHVAGGVVYVGATDGTVRALDAASGTEQWATTVGGPVYAEPVVADGSVFVTTADGSLVALATSDGTEQWRFEADYNVGHAGAAVGNGRVFFAADALYARDQGDGTGVWTATDYGGTVGSTPAYDPDTGLVVAGSGDGTIAAVDDANGGATSWAVDAGDPVGASPTLLDASLLIGDDNGDLYLLDLATGRFEDGVNVGKTRGEPVVDGTTAFVGTWEGAVANVGCLIG